MLTSLALIFLLGLSLGWIFNKLKLPSLIGMLLAGIILSPYALNLIDGSILSISSELRKIALVIILTRAGLAINIKELKKVGRPAILLCFVPACFEILAVIILAPKFLNISTIDAAIMGTVLAAVSPAVIVPRMLRLMESGYGKDKSIPQMIMAGASVDDIFVIVLFTAFISLSGGGEISASTFLKIPISIVTGISGGIIVGYLLSIFFKKLHIRDSAKVIILLSFSFFLMALESHLDGIIAFSGLLAIMSMSATILKTYEVLAKRLSGKFSKLWVAAEIMLFVLVGATVDLKYAVSAGIMTVVLILAVLIFRILGVFLCLVKTNLNKKEMLFCAFSYIPKATVQAAIGAIPLSMGLGCGQIVLTIAVLAIIITAPVGALLIDMTYKKYLKNS